MSAAEGTWAWTGTAGFPVLSPAQHYDTSDGAFWTTGGAL